ncbi:MAG TPA: hypothetical protein VEI05_02960 [Burkholderiaceae bacterium]|nr:hypothetical protein [Burkholderiaceae bacterium]
MSSKLSPKLDLSIEGMRSQQFSEAVFAFLLIAILVFSVIVVIFWFSKNRPSDARLGEKMMFGAIVMGIIVAVVFGALQMVGGILF